MSQTMITYETSDPIATVQIVRTPPKVIKGATMVLPLTGPEALSAIPVPILRALHQQVAPGRRPPRERVVLAEAVFEAATKPRRGVKAGGSTPPARESKNDTGGRTGTIGARFRELLAAKNADPEAVLAQVKREFPQSRATMKDVRIYQSQLRSRGKK